MSLLSASPILAFLDKNDTISFYEKMGFECNANWDGYLMFKRDQINIHLWLCDDEAIPKHTGCYIYVDEIETLYSEYMALDIIHPNGKLEYKPWNLKQFSILDNSGNIINFGQHIL